MKKMEKTFQRERVGRIEREGGRGEMEVLKHHCWDVLFGA